MKASGYLHIGKDTQERALKDINWVIEFLGMSKSWVYQAVESGVLPCIRIGSSVRFDPSAIRAWVQGESAASVRLPGCR